MTNNEQEKHERIRSLSSRVSSKANTGSVGRKEVIKVYLVWLVNDELASSHHPAFVLM